MKLKFLDKLICKLGLCGGCIEHVKIDGIWYFGLKCTSTGKLHNPIKSKFQDS